MYVHFLELLVDGLDVFVVADELHDHSAVGQVKELGILKVVWEGGE